MPPPHNLDAPPAQATPNPPRRSAALFNSPRRTIVFTLAAWLLITDLVYHAVADGAFQYYATQPSRLGYPIITAIICGLTLSLYHRASQPVRRRMQITNIGIAAVLTTGCAIFSACSTISLFRHDTPLAVPAWLMMIPLALVSLAAWLWHLFAQVIRPATTASSAHQSDS